ncbi:Serine/threonine-protein phosphatase 6 regulatory ankyrin repeat subunit B [Cyphellophora attinorum]|uniref:Serine/threonine-protein phosphatase 6 regulatory ankyrin repeat subunit B n=1 Tax=Cyphellophora attinorum TaxID=1664694 RepID=A0A0N1H536_9EURO|nr:Serine/threonine-protein phosphatase 6 regulatory ankyrin repeat subunit B [Phialophora attinorum]KPI40693.1 Serine/threonine-protein phosphatase 6 regulatory ankyrin repeat subunit B [Phialophora attinorum]
MAALTRSEGAEEWESVGDAAARRRIQNKLAQRRYRRNHRHGSMSRLNTFNYSDQQDHSCRHHDIPRPKSQQQIDDEAVARPTAATGKAQCTHSAGPSHAGVDCGIRTPPSSVPPFAESDGPQSDPFGLGQHYLTSSTSDFARAIDATQDAALLEFDDDFFIDQVHFADTPQAGTAAQLTIAEISDKEPSGSISHSTSRTTQPHDAVLRAVQSNASTEGRVVSCARSQSVGEPISLVLPVRTTPLHCAVLGGHIDTVRLLVASGSSLDCIDALGRTALHIAVQNDHDDLVKLLLDSKADWTTRNSKGQTALHITAQAGHIASMRTLLKVMTEINGVDNRGQTALHIAASKGDQDIVSLLIRKGANLNAGIQAGTHG